MDNSKTSTKWIEVGYERFAYDGPLGIQVERLARIIGRNKSGYYHYFTDNETFVKELVNYHYDCVNRYVEEARTLKTFDPEYLQLIVKYKLTSMFQMQLGRSPKDTQFGRAFRDVSALMSSSVKQLWADFINLPQNPDLAVRYYQFIRSSLYANARFAELDYEALHTIAHDAKAVAVEMIRTNEVPSAGDEKK